VVNSVDAANIIKTPNNIKIDSQKTYLSPEGSKEELYQDIFLTMLNSCIQNSINNYYGKLYPVDPVVKILSIQRSNGYRTFYFVIKVEVMPYQGAHNSVGLDHITLSVDISGAKVERFEHIETF
jgi:hypothetical protein